MTFTNSFTGQQIFMCGLDDEEKVRSIAVENGYISIIWFEEAKQFKNMEEIDQAVASVLRGGSDDEDSMSDDDEGEQEYMTLVTYNPPKSARHWINQEARAPKKSRLVHKSTYLTMPKKWIGKKILSEIEQMKERNPTQYRHMYLGEVTGTGLEYFTNIEVSAIGPLCNA
jgi:phage terminase large subunit